LTDMSGRELVGADTGIRAADAVVPWLHARQPRHLDIAVRLRRLTLLVAQARHDGEVLPEWLQRLQDRRHLVVGAGLRRRPLVHDGAVREPDEGEALWRGARGCRRPRGRSRTHRVEERQRDAGSNTFQHRAPRDMLFEYVHRVSPLSPRAGPDFWTRRTTPSLKNKTRPTQSISR